MIVKMKEIVIFTSSQKITTTINELGKLGVIDVCELQIPDNKEITETKNAILETENAINYLSTLVKNKIINNKLQLQNDKNFRVLSNRILKVKDLFTSCKNKITSINQQLKWYQIWGNNFQLKDLQLLKENGIFVKLYLIKKEDVKKLPKPFCIQTFSEIDNQIPIVFFTKKPEENLDFKPVHFPKNSLEDLQKQLSRKNRQLEKIDEFIVENIPYLPSLKNHISNLNDSLAIHQTIKNLQTIDNKCHYLQGYLPLDDIENFKKTAHKNHWGYQISAPEKFENVPIYIKNPKWIEIINPIMKFIDIIPGYKEVDVSIYFLLAFALFFAMLVGDAGYGLVFLLASLILRKKIPTQLRILIIVLSSSTIIWGVLSGTYFGSSEIAQIPFLNFFIIDNIASFGVDNVTFMMHLSFLIGAIHLTIAHSVRGFQFINSIKVLSQIGWIGLVWGLFFITEQLVLGKTMPDIAMWFFGIGAVLVALFSMESNNFLKSMSISLANLPLSLISGFSDIVSYVRLFAVGMATVAVAASFNTMILSSGIENMGFFQIIGATIALLLGHGLNIALALMAVMVHGIRLNMLEFASHLGVEFSGNEYKPFKIISVNKETNEHH